MSTVTRAARSSRLVLGSLASVAALAVAIVAPSAAQAAIPQVFTTTPTPVACTVQGAGATVGQRHCGTATARVNSWDSVPIDVSVTFPPVPASGPDGNFPVVGIFHGWGGSKVTPPVAATQRWVNQGYAVFSITDRGWGQSCGAVGSRTVPICNAGYIRLMHNAYEVRDVQYLLGKLVDQGVIDRQRIGATGGSYGGGMALQLGALKDRVQLPDGSLMQWQSAAGDPIKIAATAPEFPWTDLQQSLMPNGSSLDYVADSPYKGVNGDHRFGIQKNNWNATLFGAGLLLGFYAPAVLNEPTANLINWNTFNSTGGPYDGQALAIQQMNELPSHSGYYTDLSVPPAPALLSNGWNDDLFPVDETVRYYNKVRSQYPNQPIKMFHLDFGHAPRAASIPADNAKLATAENAWFAKYVRGDGATPADAQGGVDILTSKCSGTTPVSGDQFTANDWASIAPGEVRLNDNATKSIVAPGTAPSNAFTSGNVCTTTSGADNASAATYKLDPAPASGFTLAGSPTIIAEFDTIGANDMIAGRLYDVAPGGATQQLIARGVYRPLAVGDGYTQQVWQLHPQAFKVAAGHVVKLELLTQDSTYARLATGRNSVGVRNLELRLPTTDAPGSAGGLVLDPEAKYLPPGYQLARDVQTTVPGAPHITSGDNPNATGIFTLGWDASDPATALRYGLQHRDADDVDWAGLDNNLLTNAFDFTAGSPEGEGTWTYHVNAHEDDGDPSTAYSSSSAAIKVDKTDPAAPSITADRAADYSGDGGWYKDSVVVTITDNGDPALADGSDGSGVDLGSIPEPATYDTSGSHLTSSTVKDSVGNESGSSSLTVKVDATAPTLDVTCPAVVLQNGTASATVTASDAHSGLASDPSGTVAIDTSTVGPQTVTRTATDNVGHETTDSCTTQVQYMFGGFQQPINADGSSIFKLGSTVPVKFRLTSAGSNPVSGAIATIELAKIDNHVDGTFVEAVSTSAATTGNLFREAGDGQYIFNLSTKSLSTGDWRVKVTLDDGTEFTVRISLK